MTTYAARDVKQESDPRVVHLPDASADTEGEAAGMTRSSVLETLPRVRLRLGMDAPLTEYGDFDDRDIAHWSVDAVIPADDADEPEEPDSPPLPPQATLVPVESGVEGVVVARCSGYLIDLEHATNLLEKFDETEDLSHFAPLLLGAGEYELNADFDHLLDGFVSRLAILDRAEVASAWRGHGGVGRLLTARALQWVLTDTTLVVTKPFPLQFSHRGDDPDFPAAVKQVRQVWKSIGFKKWKHDIWWMDPNQPNLTRAVHRLERDLGLNR